MELNSAIKFATPASHDCSNLHATACARKENLFAPGEDLLAFCCECLSVEYSSLTLLRLYAVI